ncbi:MAG: NAD(P)H-hydrate epimerase [Planctomycetes bacterium]|nr:NAD(P)H-hydrate epimerase [Planctomycetota bacterium]
MENHRENYKNLVLSRDEVRNCDKVAIEQYGIDGVVLMENAGGAAARVILEDLGAEGGARVCIVAGTGNNGGDGFVVARHLRNVGVEAVVIICGERDRVKGDALSNLRIIENMELPIFYLPAESEGAAGDLIRRHGGAATLVVDGMLGTGMTGAAREPFATAIETINSLGKPVVALDIPSGLDCDTGVPLGVAVKAKKTVTFAAMKKGFLEKGAGDYTGEVVVASIGIDARLLRE